jgi:hypothetical protein
MDQPRGNDGSGVGSAGDCLGADEGLEIDGLAGRTGDVESLLKLLPVSRIGQEESGSLRAFLLQSLQNENTSVAAGNRQEGDGREVLA